MNELRDDCRDVRQQFHLINFSDLTEHVEDDL
jgi:hypothetical protein